MNVLEKFEAKELAKIQENKNIPDFAPGDTVKVNVKVKEGTRERIQAYEGVCIARSGSGMSETFTVRKISLGEGVERVFPLWSARVDSIELIRRGNVRRAKLYYLRDLRGKKARIAERTTGAGIDNSEEQAALDAQAKKEARAAAKAARKAKNAEKKKVKAEKKAAAEKK